MMIKVEAYVREDKFEDVKAAIKCDWCKWSYCIPGNGMRYPARI